MAAVDTKALDGPSVTLTVRLIMQGKEVGSIIGKKGDNIKKFREESGAKINISDGSCPERIVTVTGSTEAILKAFSLIARKFEEMLSLLCLPVQTVGPTLQELQSNGSHLPKPPVTLRLIVPASQCGSLIGKGGSKIKEIREVTGASIQVASEMLPNSTERAVTVSGTAEAITKCIYQICCVMMESPPKGATIPYRPKPAMPPVIFAGGQAYTVQGQYAIPHPDPGSVPAPTASNMAGVKQATNLSCPSCFFVPAPQLTKLHQLALQHAPLLPGHSVGAINPQDASVQWRCKTGPHYMAQGHLHPQCWHSSDISALAALATTNNLRPNTAAAAIATASTTTTEMTIPNDLIGCIIGKGGSKINEIRQLSGATIKISNSEEGSKDRTVTISGTPEAINLAQYLINTSMELHKNLTLDLSATHPASGPPTNSPTPPSPLAIPLSQLVKPASAAAAAAPLALLATELNNLSSAAGQGRKGLTAKIRASASAATATAAAAATGASSHNGSKKSERNKFSPY
ncbi:poly(rC)-binding protein 3 isoform X1 [Rhipicephalus microplus]|uniref:poly(rC)-binding protein 3 isoform X1 n=1 Tax=Rhipicephalus microplus TaxID=6941 RepID=UPI0018888276|nr:poly(rC)-binding protein 3-like isoform X6 [Rhipicephalus microplus]XP_037279401.1 poly(rC)-binding protein 3-like isoform X6 [Rhipicephalus microplus]XP_037279402.1 poly(rC)-binding protein 3-like isoform X6 [Rhipicephalus microplus]XP_037279403.1 poly(rC)-binding protein 3-like isoform X6 [Rhipicephalus microplus]XP_037279404.1 poly(rC)-binding protein 3-like isoform X6 [Rhipicephalus microplus]XP_037279405.1 poly(rC)-binding protein 3-like isoform X6 [Rhipicephalus microplus]XP_03727941